MSIVPDIGDLLAVVVGDVDCTIAGVAVDVVGDDVDDVDSLVDEEVDDECVVVGVVVFIAGEDERLVCGDDNLVVCIVVEGVVDDDDDERVVAASVVTADVVDMCEASDGVSCDVVIEVLEVGVVLVDRNIVAVVDDIVVNGLPDVADVVAFCLGSVKVEDMFDACVFVDVSVVDKVEEVALVDCVESGRGSIVIEVDVEVSGLVLPGVEAVNGVVVDIDEGFVVTIISVKVVCLVGIGFSDVIAVVTWLSPDVSTTVVASVVNTAKEIFKDMV